MGFQSPATEIMEKITDLHHDIMFFLIAIVFFVGWMLANTVTYYNRSNLRTVRVPFSHHTKIEQI